MKRALTVVGIGLLGLAVLILLVLSPLSLILLDQYFPAPWERLSAIGQSYTGPAALLSAAALIGLAVTIRIQTSQEKVGRLQTVREMQFNLLLFAMQDEDTGAVFSESPLAPKDRRAIKRKLYRTMILRYLQYSYLVDGISAAELQSTLADEVFTSLQDLEWWEVVGRSAWSVNFPTKKDKKFFDILDGVVSSEFRKIVQSHRGI